MFLLLKFIVGNTFHSCFRSSREMSHAILRQELNHFHFFFHDLCSNIKELYNLSRQLMFQAFSFSLLEI